MGELEDNQVAECLFSGMILREAGNRGQTARLMTDHPCASL
jgi:hypothetical protein